jgi:hypothetical protein
MVWLADRAGVQLHIHSLGGMLALFGIAGTFLVSGVVLVIALPASIMAVARNPALRTRGNALGIGFAGVALAVLVYCAISEL